MHFFSRSFAFCNLDPNPTFSSAFFSLMLLLSGNRIIFSITFQSHSLNILKDIFAQEEEFEEERDSEEPLFLRK